jgi:hypothetical protein
MRRRVAAAVKPNPAHFALAKLEQKLQERLLLCTQNVDDLHEQAGSIRVVHMHGELFKSRCDTCSRPPFEDKSTYDPPAELPRCECGGGIRPHICWFGEVPFELDRVFQALEQCTIFMAVGTSGVVEPAASFVAHVGGRARTIYVGAEEPANASAFTECHLGEDGKGTAVTGGFDSMELMSRAAGHRLCRPNSTNKVVPYFRMALAIQYKVLSATYRLKRDLVPFAIPSRFVAVVRAVTF